MRADVGWGCLSPVPQDTSVKPAWRPGTGLGSTLATHDRPRPQLGWGPPQSGGRPRAQKHLNLPLTPGIELWVTLSGRKRVLAAT